ncbi:hypothetical protein MTR_7g095760 [Medicago truncatula]|uniref:Uncharacterized protein n=1 Tax=Medicago truncatula TaxID=3880 RepID=A0A072U299_MEDTR|nr:hypothetical protein MTR_7g095760 [Medicago truncatula]
MSLREYNNVIKKLIGGGCRRFGFAKEDCGCVQMATFGLSVIGEEVDANFSVTVEWDAVQKRIKRDPYKMKLFIKYKLRELGFSEETMLNPPPRKLATKGAPKRVKSTPKTRSTGRIPGGRLLITVHLWFYPINALINELKNHKSDYLPFYATERRYKEIFDGLHPPTSKNGDAPSEKWLTTPDMGHIIASCYNRPVVLLTLPKMGGACETYFPIQSAPPLNPHSNISCLCLIPEHFLHSNDFFQFLDRQAAFDEFMSKEPMSPKKPTNEHNPINLDTPEKPKQDIKVMD